jgi:hypothetical protein
MRVQPFFLLLSLSFFSFSIFQKDISGKYVKPFNTGHILLEKAGTFFIQQMGGASGAFESKGKWVLNTDTVLMSNIQNHSGSEPWKKQKFTLKFLFRNDSLISFSYHDNTLKVNSKDGYKKLRKK